MTGAHEGTIRVIDSTKGCPELSIVIGEGSARAVLWPGNGAKWRTVNVVDLKAGSRTIDLQHPSDSAYYVDRGSGTVVDVASGAAMPLTEGAMLHIDKGDSYRFEAEGADGLLLIGGPCPADPALFEYLRDTA